MSIGLLTYQQSVFKHYRSDKHFSEFYIHDGGKNQLIQMWNKITSPSPYIHTHPFNGHFSGTTQVSRYQKGKPIWILLKQETVSGSGISWAICKSTPCSRQTTTPAPHHSVFTGQMTFLPPNLQRQSTEGNHNNRHINEISFLTSAINC